MAEKEERILVIKCGGDCRYLRVNQDPFDESAGWYCAYNPHNEWESIKPSDCEKCSRTGRFNGIPMYQVVKYLEDVLTDYAKDKETVTEYEIAEVVVKALLEFDYKNKK